MHVPKWLVTPFDTKIDNKGIESDMEDELIEMHVDLEGSDGRLCFEIRKMGSV